MNQTAFKWDATGAKILKAVQDNAHEELISLWEEQNIKGLRNEQLIQLYGSAFGAIERRCLATLSSVTINVVIDRVLHLGSKKYSFFSLVTIEPSGLSLKGLMQKNENYKTEELRDGLTYLLLEFLTVIGNITSDVLNESLHKELMEVTSESVLNRLELQRGDE